MQTRSSSKSPVNDIPPQPPPNRGRKQVGTTATGPVKKPVEKCQWTPEEEKRLILFLVSRKSEAGDGGSFKSTTWTAAVQEMGKLPTKGLIKNITACSSKYGRLRTQYNLVTNLKGLSGLGCKYTTELGMNIGVAEQSVWADYTTKHPASAAYTHKGFLLYDLMTPLMPSLAKGNNVFRPSQGTHGAASATIALTEQPANIPTQVDDPSNDIGRNSGSDNDSALPPPSSAYPPSSPISLPLPLPEMETPGVVPTPPALESQTPSASLSYTSSTSFSTSKRKRSALAASILSSGKKQRTEPPSVVALYSIKESLDTFNKTMERGVPRPEHIHLDTSPQRRTKAMDLFLEQEGYLSDDCQVAFIDLFRADTPAADAYLALKREGLRKAWVQRQLKHVGFPPTEVRGPST